MVGVTILEHLPSLALSYLEHATEMGINIRETRLRLIIGTGETLAEAVRQKMKSEYGIPIQMIYGSAEMGLIAAQCANGEGMHILADHHIVEIIDPETKESLTPGKEGEIIITPLLNEALPLIRYRMGDVGTLLPYDSCPCGRTHTKMSLVKGRVAHIVKVGGKNILPIDVEEVIATVPGLGNEYQVIVGDRREVEKLKVKVEARPEVESLRTLKEQTEEVLYHRLGISSEVELVPLGSLGRAFFKAERFVTT